MRTAFAFVMLLMLIASCSGGNQQSQARASSPPILNQGNCEALNGPANRQGSCNTPTPAPTLTPPPLRDAQSWMGEEAAEGVYSNHNATAAQIAQYDDLCEGYENTTTAIFPTTCPGPGRWGYSNGWLYYIEAGIGRPNTSGKDVNIPFSGSYVNATGKTCNAAAKITSGKFWTQQTSVTLGGTAYTIPDWTSTASNNWFTYVAGGTTGDVHFLGAGWSGSEYYFYLNLNSASLVAYVNDVIGNCAYNSAYNTAGATFDNGNVTEDNTYFGLESQTWDTWDRYNTGNNFATGPSAPNPTPTPSYADPRYGSSGNAFAPTAFFNGTAHVRATKITASNIPITYPQDTSFRTAQAYDFANFTHADGSLAPIEYNGMINTDQTANKNPNTRFGVAEEIMVGCFGACGTPPPLPYNGPTKEQSKSALGTDNGPRTYINDVAAMYREVELPGYNTQISNMVLGDEVPYIEGATSTTVLGTGISQQNIMWEYAPILLMYSDDFPDHTAEFSNFCGVSSNTALAGSNCMDNWPFDYVMPSGRLTAMPADPSGAAGAQPCGEYAGYNYEGTGVHCTAGGSYDAALQAGGTSGLLRSEFNHLWAFKVTGSAPCAAYDRRQWAACAIDLGGLCEIINATGGSVVVNSTNVASWCPNTNARLAHVLVSCTPNANYFGTAASGPIYAMPQSGTLGYGTAQICTGNTGFDVPSGGTWDNSHPLSTITSNSQLLYDGQTLYLTP